MADILAQLLICPGLIEIKLAQQNINYIEHILFGNEKRRAYRYTNRSFVSAHLSEHGGQILLGGQYHDRALVPKLKNQVDPRQRVPFT